MRLRSGEKLVQSVIARFDRAVADLEVAGRQIEHKRGKNYERLNRSKAAHDLLEITVQGENEALRVARVRAETVRKNIAALVGTA